MSQKHVYIGDRWIVFHAFRQDRPLRVAKVIYDGSRTYALTDKGKLFCTGSSGRRMGSSISLQSEEGLRLAGIAHAFGVIDQTVYDTVVKEADRAVQLRSAAYYADNFEDAAEEAGIKLTAAQKAEIAHRRRVAPKRPRW